VFYESSSVYLEEFKEQAVRLALSTEKTYRQIALLLMAHQLGLITMNIM
jgi:transposase-like protein